MLQCNLVTVILPIYHLQYSCRLKFTDSKISFKPHSNGHNLSCPRTYSPYCERKNALQNCLPSVPTFFVCFCFAKMICTFLMVGDGGCQCSSNNSSSDVVCMYVFILSKDLSSCKHFSVLICFLLLLPQAQWDHLSYASLVSLEGSHFS